MDIIFFGGIEKLEDFASSFGPQAQGTVVSVRPGYLSPPCSFFLFFFFYTDQAENTDGHPQCNTEQTCTFSCPPRSVTGCPLLRGRWSRPWVKMPCLVGKPCWSFPPLIQGTQPSHFLPRVSAATCARTLLRKGMQSAFFGHFNEFVWQPGAGKETS